MTTKTIRQITSDSSLRDGSTDEDEDIFEFASLKEVAEKQKQLKREGSNSLLLVYRGVVYDCQEYAEAHPGSSRILRMHAGKSIDKSFDEQNHTSAAFFVMNQLPIFGRVKDQRPT